MKLFSLLLFLLIYSTVFCQQTLVISGQLPASNNASQLYILNGMGTTIRIPVQPGRRFSFRTDSLERGFYQTNLTTILYLAPGFQLNVRPDKQGKLRFQGLGAAENNSLQQARETLTRFLPVDERNKPKQEAFLMSPDIFMQRLDSFLLHGRQFFAQSRDTLFVHCANIDLELFAKTLLLQYFMNYGFDLKKKAVAEKAMNSYTSNHPRILGIRDSLLRPARIKTLSFADQQAIGKRLFSNWKEIDETAFRYLPEYRVALGGYIQSLRFKYLNSKEKPRPEDMDIAALKAVGKEISNPFVKAYFEHEFTRSLLRKITDSARLQQYYEAYTATNPRPEHLAEIQTVFNRAMALSGKGPAPSFSYTDISGKTVTLESLRGSYVYIDVWATWCGPCLAEIPHLKKLAAAYTGKNIRFVSISADEVADKEKWKRMVKARQLGGLQLFADKAFASSFIQTMQIDAIPRFILIGPDGKIISANALRPSDKALRQQLDALKL